LFRKRKGQIGLKVQRMKGLEGERRLLSQREMNGGDKGGPRRAAWRKEESAVVEAFSSDFDIGEGVRVFRERRSRRIHGIRRVQARKEVRRAKEEKRKTGPGGGRESRVRRLEGNGNEEMQSKKVWKKG